MPRDSSGAYSLPSGTLVNSGDTILVSQHNPAMRDIADALGNSLDRNGSGGMRAPLDMGGYPVRNLPEGTLPTDAATVAQLGAGVIPVGAVFDYAGATAPTGYLLCFGQTVSRTDFAELFAVLGTTYGAGDGVTTFGLPDLRGRVTAAPDNMGGTPANRLKSFTANAPGAAGGNDRETLTVDQIPSHDHGGNTGTTGAHTHSGSLGISYGGSWPGNLGFEEGRGTPDWRAGNMGSAGDHRHTIGAQGGGQAHFNVQPTIVLNKIIKARSA